MIEKVCSMNEMEESYDRRPCNPSEVKFGLRRFHIFLRVLNTVQHVFRNISIRDFKFQRRIERYQTAFFQLRTIKLWPKTSIFAILG